MTKLVPHPLMPVLRAIWQAMPGRADRARRVALVARCEAIAAGKRPPVLRVVVPAETVAILDAEARRVCHQLRADRAATRAARLRAQALRGAA